MCLSNAYRESDRELLMANTSKIRTEGDEVILVDLFGDVRKIKGTLLSVDLEKNEAVIRTA